MLPIIFFLVSTIAPGLAIGSFLYPRLINARQFLALSYGFGTAALSFELFLYFVILRLPSSPAMFWFFGLQTAAAIIIFSYRFPWNRTVAFAGMSTKFLTWLAAVVLAALLGLSLVQALGKPPVAFDTIAFWSMRAEVLLKAGRVDFNPASPTYLSAMSHSNYPWHLSLMEYWIRAIGVSGGGVNLISWLYFLSLSILAADFLVRWLGPRQGLLLTLFLCSQPLVFYHASNNYADLIVGYYAAAGFAFFLRWLEERQPAYLMLAAALTGWTFNIKNYGSFYILAFLFGLALAYALKVQRVSARSWSAIALALLLPVLPIALFKTIFRLNLRNTDPAWVWHPEAAKAFGVALFTDNNWNIWWFVFAAILVCLLPRIVRRAQLYIPWLMFGAVLVILLVVFTVTENYQWALDHTALPRSFIPLVPISILLAAYSFKQAASSAREEKKMVAEK